MAKKGKVIGYYLASCCMRADRGWGDPECEANLTYVRLCIEELKEKICILNLSNAFSVLTEMARLFWCIFMFILYIPFSVFFNFSNVKQVPQIIPLNYSL